MILQENARLRKVVESLSGFIGDGLGGAAARMGLTAEGIDAISKEGYHDLLIREAGALHTFAQEAQRRAELKQDPSTGRYSFRAIHSLHGSMTCRM